MSPRIRPSQKRELGLGCCNAYKSLKSRTRMITKIKFKNFKVLRDTELPLGQFTLIVGPNGSGKSTVFQALRAFSQPEAYHYAMVASVANPDDVEVIVSGKTKVNTGIRWGKGTWTSCTWDYYDVPNASLPKDAISDLRRRVNGCHTFSFDPAQIAAPVTLEPNIQMTAQGGNLAGVLDRLATRIPSDSTP